MSTECVCSCLVSDATVGHIVKRMEATDPDLGASLVYYLEEPKQAWDTRGQEVAPSTYEFRVGGPLSCNTHAHTHAGMHTYAHEHTHEIEYVFWVCLYVTDSDN